MAISAKQVKALRDKTGAGMMDCKKALVQHDGDVDKALEYLQVKGQAATTKRAGRDANEGVVFYASSDDSKRAVLVEVNCETDFVARNADFQGFVAKLAAHAIENAPSDAVSWLDQSYNEAQTVKEFVVENAATIGENVVIKNVAYYSVDGEGMINGYVHHDKKTGVIVQVNGANGDDVKTLAKQLSMHIAASKPVAISSDDIDADTVAQQRALYEAQGRETGKPDKIVTKIAEGRLRKWFTEVCLLNQPFVMDSDMTVAQLLKARSKDTGGTLSIPTFDHFIIGS